MRAVNFESCVIGTILLDSFCERSAGLPPEDSSIHRSSESEAHAQRHS
jgi:hypothetical protein